MQQTYVCPKPCTNLQQNAPRNMKDIDIQYTAIQNFAAPQYRKDLNLETFMDIFTIKVLQQKTKPWIKALALR